MIFDSISLRSFQMSAIYSFLKYLGCTTDRQRQAVVTLKIDNSGLDRLCATHFLVLHPSWGFDTKPLLQIRNRFHTLHRLSGSNICKFV